MITSSLHLYVHSSHSTDKQEFCNLITGTITNSESINKLIQFDPLKTSKGCLVKQDVSAKCILWIQKYFASAVTLIIFIFTRNF